MVPVGQGNVTGNERILPQEWAQLRALGRSVFVRNAAWLTGLSVLDRVVAVVQTVLVSRALGITEYGIYGLLFGTIGFIASIAGMQMGLTATVFVSKYRATERAKAAAVMVIVGRFGWAVAGAFALMAAPFSSLIAEALLASSRYQMAIVLGIGFVGASIIGGVQDGIAQGFEIFGSLARLKSTISLLVLAAIFFGARNYGLNGVLCATLGGLVAKYLILRVLVARARSVAGIPQKGSGVSFRALVSEFAFPSMAVSLAVGFATWLGMFLLSRQSAGFDAVAIVNTGLQWRGPALLVAASLGGVAVPAFSRLDAHSDVAGSRRLRVVLSLLNLTVASLVAFVVIAASGQIMRLYGGGFAVGRTAFSLIVLSTVPSVVANVYLQELVGTARMWRQLWLHGPYLVVTLTAFALLVPRYNALGYSVAILLGSTVLLAHIVLADRAMQRSRTSTPA